MVPQIFIGSVSSEQSKGRCGVIVLHVTGSLRIVRPADVFHTGTHLPDHRVTYELCQCVWNSLINTPIIFTIETTTNAIMFR
jgi:hypothetical protein